MKYWFWLSLIAAAVLVGMALGTFQQFHIRIVGVGMTVIGLAFVYKKAPSLIVEYGLVCVALLLGGVLTTNNTFSTQQWMSESMHELSAQLLTNEVEDFSLQKVRNKRKSPFADLRIANHNVSHPILVAFNNLGLVLLHGKEIWHTTQEKLFLLAHVEPDNTFMFYKKTVRQPNQTLYKAKLVNNDIEILWQKPFFRKYLHHWGDVFKGRYYQAGRTFQNLPNELSQQIGHTFADCEYENSFADQIHIMNYEDGEILETIDLIPIIAKYKDGDAIRKNFHTCKNTLHLNSIQILKNRREARYFPNGKIGDMLISMRDVNTIMLLDRETHTPKWHVVGGKENGMFVEQHSPRVTDRGTVLVFDNKGSDEENGRSRVVEIDIATRELIGSYEATGNEHFDSRIGGKVEYDNGRIVVSESAGKKSGRNKASMFLLDCPTTYVSDDCSKTMIFSGNSKFDYNRAVILQGDMM